MSISRPTANVWGRVHSDASVTSVTSPVTDAADSHTAMWADVTDVISLGIPLSNKRKRVLVCVLPPYPAYWYRLIKAFLVCVTFIVAPAIIVTIDMQCRSVSTILAESTLSFIQKKAQRSQSTSWWRRPKWATSQKTGSLEQPGAASSIFCPILAAHSSLPQSESHWFK